MSDRSPETLVNDLKSPAKFEITLKAFKRFDCPPMYAYEYLNLQTVPRDVQTSSDAEIRHQIYRISSPARDFYNGN